MAKLGVITDGISREFEHALAVMNEVGLTQAELQYVWDKEVGDLSDAQLDSAQRLVAAHGLEVSCVSRHIFGGLALGDLSSTAPVYREHLAALNRCIDMAQALDCPLVRIMSFKKEMILFGSQGAEEWNVAQGAWDKARELIGGAAQIAEDRAITLVVETGNNAITNSAFLARRMVDEVGSARLKVMWDPANALYSTEAAYPDGYDALKGALGHIHLKDVVVEISKATIACRQLGTGQMAPYLDDLATALKNDGYGGAISLESVYRPLGGSFEDGFRASVGALKAMFG